MIDFFSFCSEMLCVADHRGYFVELNPAWTATLGWSLEELKASPYLDFVHPDDREATLLEASQLRSEQYETVQFQNRYRCKDGTYKWLAWKAKPKPNTSDLLATARDVTDEYNQFVALEKSEERFRSLAEHAPIGIAQADGDGRVNYVNSRLCEIAGVDTEFLLGLNWHKLIVKADRDWFLPLWHSHLDSGTNISPKEIRLSRPDGTLRWVACSIALVKSQQGRTEGQIATIEDIHARKTSSQQLHALINQAPVGIATMESRTGRFMNVNAKFEEILGRSARELSQLDWPSVTHADDVEVDKDNMESLLKGEIQQFRVSKRYIRPSGEIRWADLTVVPLWQEGDEGRSHLAIAVDTSDHKVAEENLRTKEAQLEGLLDHSSNVIYLKDREGKYLLVNQEHKKLFGRMGEIIGKTDYEFFPKEVARVLRDYDAQVWEDESTHVFTEVVSHEDGPHTYRSVKFPLKNSQGKMLAMGGISTDITDLTTAYEELAEKERLLQNLIEIQESEKRFICYEFHDGLIQHAFGSMMALESLLDKNLSEKSSAIVENAVNSLQKGIEDGRRVIRGIRPTVLDDMGVMAAIEDLIDLMPKSDIQVELEFDPGVGRLPKTLEATIYRVTQEAINNARKHSGSDRMTISLKRHSKRIQLDIRDFGCGFDVQSAKHAGFGLAGMTERVRLLNGTCQIISSRGKGTQIQISAPIEFTAEDYDSTG
jgi:PAS domain S-box-containing protein